MLFYELLYNKLPFYDYDVQKMYYKVIVEKVVFPSAPKISPECKDFIKRLLYKSPSKRLGSLADTLEIMNHSFFKNFNWFRMLDKSHTAPYQPFQNPSNWLDNFCPNNPSKRQLDSICFLDPSLVRKYEEEFEVFNSESQNEQAERA